MTISTTVKRDLEERGIPYDVVAHEHTGSSLQTAQAAHIPGGYLAKAIVLKDAEGYVMAVTSADYKLSTSELYDALGRHLDLVQEEELGGIFKDCDLGAVPPLAPAYGMEAVWDDSLAMLDYVFFEGGDHDHIVRVKADDFKKLMGDAQHAQFSHHL